MHFHFHSVRAFAAVWRRERLSTTAAPRPEFARHWSVIFFLLVALMVLPAIALAETPAANSDAGKTASQPAAQPVAADTDVIYPRNNAAAAANPAPAGKAGSGSNTMLLIVAAGAAGAGGWMMWRQRRTPAGIAGREARKLAVSETRSLGNRQYLVVADYDGKKFLLGVCPGRIDLLSPLDGSPPAAGKN